MSAGVLMSDEQRVHTRCHPQKVFKTLELAKHDWCKVTDAVTSTETLSLMNHFFRIIECGDRSVELHPGCPNTTLRERSNRPAIEIYTGYHRRTCVYEMVEEMIEQDLRFNLMFNNCEKNITGSSRQAQFIALLIVTMLTAVLLLSPQYSLLLILYTVVLLLYYNLVVHCRPVHCKRVEPDKRKGVI
ncbi:CUN106 similar to AcMNPV ORF81 [Culex nigripalpus nucleopolyhedrovirus]|uniref:CUN106 similar to AcMNPV ORF81 n=1 Tax=Culex nigripalpus nucleopolyhedrovirus (isolate Florida/1997) TaxID=645993 RepID=Q919H1_NPVCO|nr:CUN106 similar to AcMNPV ORF81 [Culex nigripalpus nucleopolyhedrovirus]AAK94184.1 CUN106 similar to AcMNPV ORF81 [Culex nigripalpus nucleopolyhedrovirus]